ncbi:hypothetical protein [Tsukamurella sp. NPDC003166]|uniref:hypothetical protein n=1 Tax=Tsukamurella sp. NPDC003166 TaxID=3154444 RepID=UPI0033B0655F
MTGAGPVRGRKGPWGDKGYNKLALGSALGVALGAVVGVALGNGTMGIVIGLALGIALAGAFGYRSGGDDGDGTD